METPHETMFRRSQENQRSWRRGTNSDAWRSSLLAPFSNREQSAIHFRKVFVRNQFHLSNSNAGGICATSGRKEAAGYRIASVFACLPDLPNQAHSVLSFVRILRRVSQHA